MSCTAWPAVVLPRRKAEKARAMEELLPGSACREDLLGMGDRAGAAMQRTGDLGAHWAKAARLDPPFPGVCQWAALQSGLWLADSRGQLHQPPPRLGQASGQVSPAGQQCLCRGC